MASEDTAHARHFPWLTSQIGLLANPVQSAFDAHSPHTPFVHCERQSSEGVVHTAPSLRPQRLSFTSHTPLSHTRAPFAAVQVLEIGALAGSAWPFGVLGVQVPALFAAVGLSHHLPAFTPVQSPSAVQVEPHAPEERLQMLPAGFPAQSAFEVHFPQDPSVLHRGFAVVLHSCVAPEPLSPLQATQVLEATLHVGVTPAHCERFEAEHCAQVPSVLHAGRLVLGQA